MPFDTIFYDAAMNFLRTDAEGQAYPNCTWVVRTTSKTLVTQARLRFDKVDRGWHLTKTLTVDSATGARLPHDAIIDVLMERRNQVTAARPPRR